MKQFIYGVVVTTTVWLFLLSKIEIPEYTIIHKNETNCPKVTII